MRGHRQNREDDKRRLQELLLFLESPSLATRIATVKDIGALGSVGIPAAKQLVPLISDIDDDLRNAAILALVSIGHGSKRVAKAVRGLLDDESPDQDPYTRTRAYWILERIEG